jgi:hypothetical protein
MFFVQIIMYILLIINWRAVSQANYFVSVVSDILIAAMGFFVLKKILSDDGSWMVFAGYVSGSAAGSALGILISKLMLGQ